MIKPKIRFKGYQEEWEQRKFKELCDMVTVGIANSATHAYSDSGVVMFRNQNIKPNFLDDTDIIHINSEFEVKYKNKRLKKNDLLVARTGYPGTACVVPEKYENSQTFTTLIARPNENVDPYFLCQYLNSDIGIKYFESTQIGGGQKNSGAGILNEMPVTLPSTIEEEKQIADYFIQLDHLITLHHRKCEEMKILKKYMLQKMFPQNGNSVPEIRFLGFTEDWEQRKLGDLVDRVTRKNQDLVSELPLTISAQYGLIDQNEFFDKRVASKDVSGYYLIENGEFAYNKSTSTDAPWGAIKRLDRYENGVLSTLYIVFGIKENNPVYSDFLVSYYSTNLWHKGIHEIAAEGARNHGLLNIAPADFFETKLKIPQDIEEQKKIGKYFEELERLITLHQKKCDELRNIKKFMLQNMFI